MTDLAPATARRTGAGRASGGLDGRALPLRAWLLLAAGTAGGLAFTGVYLAEGATRAGYRALAQPISALSLGPGGWVQQLNFIVFGVLVCLSAAGWRAALAPGRGAVAFPVLRIAAGAGLVMDGLFAQDPSGGYPPGARPGAVTVHGQLHTLFAVITITALASGCFVLAARFAAEPAWRPPALRPCCSSPRSAPRAGTAGWAGSGNAPPGQPPRCSLWRCSPGSPPSAFPPPGHAACAGRPGGGCDDPCPGGGTAAESARRG